MKNYILLLCLALFGSTSVDAGVLICPDHQEMSEQASLDFALESSDSESEAKVRENDLGDLILFDLATLKQSMTNYALVNSDTNLNLSNVGDLLQLPKANCELIYAKDERLKPV
jgi:hypothetical protein